MRKRDDEHFGLVGIHLAGRGLGSQKRKSQENRSNESHREVLSAQNPSMQLPRRTIEMK